MKKLPFLMAFILYFSGVFAHQLNYSTIIQRNWTIAPNNKQISASFLLEKDGIVVLEKSDGDRLSISLSNLSLDDQQWVLKRRKEIQQLNHQNLHPTIDKTGEPANYQLYALVLFILGLGLIGTFQFVNQEKVRYLLPILLVGFIYMSYSFTKKTWKSLANDPSSIDSAFVPFKPNVNTFWDNTYFYVESHGIPTTHPMMVGISSHGWQQQVPIPQCYLGNNAWPIPLNPVLAANPIPVDSIHFTRGAIAIAVNGVPIFNVHTNTGVDSYLDGQLDTYGGHCGRGDDYHYHIAPLHLYGYTSSTLPCAYGLDGFPVYGNVEPDGTAMQNLDANHGHFVNGNYHYHGTNTAPYMIAAMAGEVTEDSTHQLIPQAAAHPVRPGLTPLNGALITNCQPNASNNGYNLTYTLNGQTDSVVYSWTTAGIYTFRFYTAGNGTFTEQVYNGFVPCNLPTSMNTVSNPKTSNIAFPNPFQNELILNSGKQVNVQLMDENGKLINELNIEHNGPYKLETKNLEKGIYFLKTKDKTGKVLTQKLIKL